MFAWCMIVREAQTSGNMPAFKSLSLHVCDVSYTRWKSADFVKKKKKFYDSSTSEKKKRLKMLLETSPCNRFSAVV